MSTLVEIQAPREERSVPATRPLDMVAWRAFLAKGDAQDRRTDAAAIKAVKGISIAAVIVATVFWSDLGAYHLAARFVVAAGAVVLMFQAISAKQYTVAAVFGYLAVFFNPVIPLFQFSGDWQRIMVAASAIPFAASLAWTKARTGSHD